MVTTATGACGEQPRGPQMGTIVRVLKLLPDGTLPEPPALPEDWKPLAHARIPVPSGAMDHLLVEIPGDETAPLREAERRSCISRRVIVSVVDARRVWTASISSLDGPLRMDDLPTGRGLCGPISRLLWATQHTHSDPDSAKTAVRNCVVMSLGPLVRIGEFEEQLKTWAVSRGAVASLFPGFVDASLPLPTCESAPLAQL